MAIASETVAQHSRTRLLALAGALQDLGLRTRLVAGDVVHPLVLRVWDPARQSLGESVVCMATEEGWIFAGQRAEARIALAEGCAQSHEATDAARAVSRRVSGR